MDSTLAIVVAVVTIVSLAFSGFEASQLRRQTKLLAAASELSFNLAVMVRLQEILFAVADHGESFDAVWGTASDENTRSHVATQSLLDVLSMAVAAVERLPDSPVTRRTGTLMPATSSNEALAPVRKSSPTPNGGQKS